MSNPVVTFSRQHGSGGEEVAALVADRLGVPLLENEIRQRAAARAGVTVRAVEEAERPTSWMARMLERLGTVGMMADGGGIETAPPLPTPSSERFREVLDDVVRDAAAQGAVIMGHAAHLTLRDQPGVLRVFVQAPLEARVARIAHEEQLPPAEARRRIEQQDRERVRFYNDTYHVNWYDTRLYDCVVDTHLLGIHGAADVVMAMAQRVCLEPSESLPTAAAEPVTADGVSTMDPFPEPAETINVRGGDVRVRPMDTGDAGALLQLFRSLPPEELLFLRRNVTDALVIEAWEREVVDGKMLTLLAETIPAEGELPVVVGEASLRRSDVPWTSHVGEVRAITAPSYRGRGLGRALLAEVMRAAQDAGIDKLTAETMAEQVGAQRLLEGLGFREEGRYSAYARDLTGTAHDLVVMTFTRATQERTHQTAETVNSAGAR